MFSREAGRIRFFLILIIAVALIVYFGKDSLFKNLLLQKNEVGVYFIKNSVLTPVKRPVANDLSAAEKLSLAVTELLKGPDEKEKKLGYLSFTPKKLRLINAKIVADLAWLDFSRELAYYGGGSSTIQSIINQIVYTATEFKEIKKVKFFIEGKDEEIVLGGEGLVIDRPLGRSDLNL